MSYLTKIPSPVVQDSDLATAPRPARVTTDTPVGAYVTAGGNVGYLAAPIDPDDDYAEVQWDHWVSGCRELVLVRRLRVPVDGPDYRPAHLRGDHLAGAR